MKLSDYKSREKDFAYFASVMESLDYFHYHKTNTSDVNQWVVPHEE